MPRQFPHDFNTSVLKHQLGTSRLKRNKTKQQQRNHTHTLMLLAMWCEGKGLVMQCNVLWGSVLPAVTLASRQRHLYVAHLAEGIRLGTSKKQEFCRISQAEYAKIEVQ